MGQEAGLYLWMASTLLKSSESSRPKTLSFYHAYRSGKSTLRKLEPTITTWWASALCSAFTLGTTSFTRSGMSAPHWPPSCWAKQGCLLLKVCYGDKNIIKLLLWSCQHYQDTQQVSLAAQKCLLFNGLLISPVWAGSSRRWLTMVQSPRSQQVNSRDGWCKSLNNSTDTITVRVGFGKINKFFHPLRCISHVIWAAPAQVTRFFLHLHKPSATRYRFVTSFCNFRVVDCFLSAA